MKMGKMVKRVALILLTLMLPITAWVLWADSAVELTEYTVVSERLPAEFDGYRIAQISDLHNREFGNGNSELLGLLEKARPDMIVITGDVLDFNNTDIKVATDFITEAMKIAPCYYVTGNHETYIKDAVKLIADTGIKVLQSEEVILRRGDSEIAVVGVDDPVYSKDFSTEVGDILAGRIGELYSGDRDRYRILLSHNPDHFRKYVRARVDLAFCGHIHGGQLRLPFVGGMLSPNRTFFPEYDSGIYTEGNTAMIVSRGLGNSAIPVRFNNRPEIVLAVLHSQG